MVYAGSRQFPGIAGRPTKPETAIARPPADEAESRLLAAICYAGLTVLQLHETKLAMEIVKEAERLFTSTTSLAILHYAIGLVEDNLDATSAERRWRDIFSPEMQASPEVRLIYLALVAIEQAKLPVIDKIKIKGAIEELRSIAETSDGSVALRAKALLEAAPLH